MRYYEGANTDVEEKLAMVREISVEDLAAKLTEPAVSLVLLDVRQPFEHAIAAIPGSLLIPLNELGSRLSELSVPEGARLIVYCHHGIRSLTAAALLERCGLRDVASLSGGIDAWSLRIDPRVPRY